MLAVLDPTAYEYAGLSNTYSEGFRQDHYDLVSTWWHQMHMAIWIDKPFPTKVCVLCASPSCCVVSTCLHVCAFVWADLCSDIVL